MAMSANDLQEFMDYIDGHRVHIKSSDSQVLLVSDLPALDASWTGATAVVRDALLPLWHAAPIGGGSARTYVMWNGTQWICM